MSTIESRVHRIVTDRLDADPDKVTNGAAFIDDLGADSLDFIELLMEAEAEFDIDISDDEAEPVKTVGDAIALIARKVNA